MSKLSEIIEILRKNEELLISKYKVKNIGIFGSVSRGEETILSDVDIIVEFEGMIGWEIVDLKEFLENILQVKVDLLTKNALMQKPELWNAVKENIIYV